MKRLNIQLEEHKLQKLKLLALVENKSVAAVIREATDAYLKTRQDLPQKVSEMILLDDTQVEQALEESFAEFGELYRKLAQ